MKKFIFFLILIGSASANAQINVLCGNGSGGNLDCSSTSPSLTSVRSRIVAAPTGGQRPSSELVINNSNNDIVLVQATMDSPSGLLSVLSNNKGFRSEYRLNVGGALYQANARNSDDINLLGDTFGPVTVDISGYRGMNGRSASQMCLAKVDAGFYGNAQADDTVRAYRNQNNVTTCDAGMLNAIAAASPADFCPSGYTYRADLGGSASQSFMVNRRKYMNECVKTDQVCINNTPGGCVDSGGLFHPDFVFKTIGNSCPTGYSMSGPTQEYPCPHSGDDPNCSNNAETVECSTLSCPTGILKKSFETSYGATITREPGESGSFGGKINLFVYDLDSTAINFANGANGSIGANDLVAQPSYQKYCVRILDNQTASLDATSPERNVPSVNLHMVTFYPLKVNDPSGLPNVLFPVRAATDAVGVFKRMDSSARDYIFKNIIMTAP